jgi:hypothetical protein
MHHLVVRLCCRQIFSRHSRLCSHRLVSSGKLRCSATDRASDRTRRGRERTSQVPFIDFVDANPLKPVPTCAR